MLGLRATCGAEDLSELAHALERFERVRRFLPDGHGDANRYHSARALLHADGFAKESGKRELRRAERDEAMAGSDVLFDEHRWKLVRLRSKAAAQWWGLGTRWCTAGRSDNRFERYAGLGELLVLLTPVDRYQLSCATGEFRSSNDGRADLAQVLRWAPHGLSSLLHARTRQGGQGVLRSTTVANPI